MKNLAIGLAGIGIIYFVFFHKKGDDKKIFTGGVIEDPADKGFTIKDPTDPTGAVFVVLNGKRYGFSSEQAFVNYGYSQPQILTKKEVEAFPSGGWVNADGRVIQG